MKNERSEQPPVAQVYRAIAAVAGQLAKHGIVKDRRNSMQNYNFRGIDDVYNALAPLLCEHGLVILPRMLSREVIERTTKLGSAIFYVTLLAEFDFVSAADGSKHTIRTFGEAMDSGDKATNKAMSAAYKYAAFQAFCIPTEAEDADMQTHEVRAMRPGVQPAVKAPAVVLDSPGEHKIEAECTHKGVKISALPEQWLQASAREQRRQAALTPSDNANIRAFLDQRPAVAGIKPVDFSRAKPLSLEDDEVML